MTTALIETVGKRKVRFSREAVRLFHRHWPAHGMSEDRSYWFEFDASGDLVDTDVPEHSDGAAAAALADEAREYLQRGVMPPWLPSSNPSVRRIGDHIRSLEDAYRFLDGAESRKLAHNTVVRRHAATGAVDVVLHRTPVVTYTYSGWIILRSGGYRTATTKQRINQLLPPGWRLNQKDYDWTLTTPAGEYDFYDGITLRVRDGVDIPRPGNDDGYRPRENPAEPIDMPGGYGDDTISGYIDSRKEGAKMMSFDGVDTGWRLDAVLKEYRNAEGDRRVAVRLRKYPTKSKSVNRPVFFAGGLLLLDDGSLFRGTRISLSGPEFAPSTWQQMDRLALDEAEHWLSVDADDEASGLFDEEE